MRSRNAHSTRSISGSDIVASVLPWSGVSMITSCAPMPFIRSNSPSPSRSRFPSTCSAGNLFGTTRRSHPGPFGGAAVLAEREHLGRRHVLASRAERTVFRRQSGADLLEAEVVGALATVGRDDDPAAGDRDLCEAQAMRESDRALRAQGVRLCSLSRRRRTRSVSIRRWDRGRPSQSRRHRTGMAGRSAGGAPGSPCAVATSRRRFTTVTASPPLPNSQRPRAPSPPRTPWSDHPRRAR